MSKRNDPTIMQFTIGVRRIGEFFYKRYKARYFEAYGSRLLIQLVDGSDIDLPDLDSLEWKLYPDYQRELARVAAVKQQIETAKRSEAEQAAQIEMLALEKLRQMVAQQQLTGQGVQATAGYQQQTM